MTDVKLTTRDAHLLALQGVDNYRDLGGYAGQEGRTIRWGRFFRSGHLANITEFDLEQVRPLNIRSVFDLRRESERSEFPSNWHGRRPPDIITIELAKDLHASTMDLVQQIMAGAIGHEEVYSHVLSDYRRIPIDYAPLMKTLCQQLAEEEGGVLVHCMAGKDRTGVLVGLMLNLLGVSRSDIHKDYMLSNVGFDPEAKLQRLAKHYEGKVQQLDEKVDVVRLMARVETDYLDAAMAEAETMGGGLEGYFRELVGIDLAEIEQIRRNLLT